MSVTFGDEPQGDDRWQPIADACRLNPGKWGRVDLDITARGYASIIRQGKLKAFRPAGDFDAKTVNGRLWIRYIGTSDPTTD